MLYRVESTFSKARRIDAATFALARESYLQIDENESGWSFPEGAIIRVHRESGEYRDYQSVDGFFERI